MLSIFKKTSGSPAPTDKVGDYNFKAHYPDINLGVMWSEIEPYIRQATRRYILDFVGQPLYDDLATKIQAGTALTAEQAEFVERMRDAVAYCAIMTLIPKRKSAIASMGIVENVAKEGTTSTSLWGFRTLLWSVAQDADRCTDEMLQYLEAQVKAGVAYFDLWKNNAAFSAGKADLFRSTSDFQAYQNINNSRRTYISLLPVLKQATKQHLIPVLSQTQYDALVTAVRANTFTAAQTALLEKVRMAAAAWAVYYATNKMAVLPDQDGFRVIGNADAIDQRAYSAEITQGAIQRIRDAAEQDARQNTADLTAFLSENEDDYPLWKVSTSNPANDTDHFVTPFGSEYGAVML